MGDSMRRQRIIKSTVESRLLLLSEWRFAGILTSNVSKALGMTLLGSLMACSGPKEAFDGGSGLPASVTQGELGDGANSESLSKPRESDDSVAPAELEAVKPGQVNIGTEITGVNLAGILEIDGKVIANAEVVVVGSDCKGTTDSKGYFSIQCPFQERYGTLQVTVMLGGEEQKVEFDAESFRVLTEGASPFVASLNVLHSFKNFVIGRIAPVFYFLGSNALKSDVSFWQGFDQAVFGSNIPLNQNSAEGYLETVPMIHNVSHNHAEGISLLSGCNQLMGNLLSVQRDQTVTLSYAGGTSASSLTFRKGITEKVVAMPSTTGVSWICGTAYDSKRNTFWASNIVGQALLLSVKNESSPLTLQAELVGPYLGEMAYVSSADQLIGVDATASAQVNNLMLSSLRTADLKGFDLASGGAGQPPSKLTVTEKPLSPAIPVCFRDSNVQLHDGLDSALLHITDNVSLQRAEVTGAPNPTLESSRHRIYRIWPDGRTELLFTTDSRVQQGAVGLESDYCAY